MARDAMKAENVAIRRDSMSNAIALVTGAVTMSVVAVGGLVAAIILAIQGYPYAAIITAVPAITMAVTQFVRAVHRPRG